MFMPNIGIDRALLLVALGTLAAVLATRSATGGSPVLAVREDW